MYKLHLLKIIAALSIGLFITACQSPSKLRSAENNPAFDLDTLYTLPSIIGTAPQRPVWSADGQHLVFLWNDQGQTFRDVWHYSIKTGQKKRLTHLADQVENEQWHPGISEVVWLDAAQNRIAYVLDGKLYAQTTETEPKAMAADQSRISQLAVSPNGQHLAFTTTGSLWVRSTNMLSTTAARQLVKPNNDKSRISSFSWSRDSQQLVYQSTDNSPLPERDIYYDAAGELQKDRVMRAFPGDSTALYSVGVVSLDGRTNRVLSRPNAADYVWNYGLSSDGRSVFINSSDLLVKHHRVDVYDVTTGTRTPFYHEHDPKHLRPDWQVAWAPNDDGLIILTDRDGYLHLYHQATAQAEPRALTSGRWEIAAFEVDHNQQDIYFTANRSHVAERQLYRVSINGGDVERVSPATAGTHQMSLANGSKHLSSLFSSDDQPLELYVIDTISRTAEKVTQSPQPSFYQQPWANISYIEFSSHLDGTPLVGRLSLPADYQPQKRYPLIVGSVYSDSVRNQYGGRTSHPTWGFDQYLTAKGYIVLNVNVRGSWGQGRQHNQGLRHGYGVIDIEDLHSGVKHLIETGYVDPDRVGIWGSSYGGLMAMMSLFKKPGVYAVGIAGAPATNVAHAYPGQMWVMGEPTGEDQPGRYQQQSPLYHTAGLQDPLMIIHGSKDPVVLYSDTIAVIEKLIAQQQLFELVTLPGTSHGWDNEGNDVRLFAFKKMIEFFDRHLKPQQ